MTQHDRDAVTSPPTTRASSSTRRSASSSRSRRTRRGPSARPSSTRSATARCSSTWVRSTRRPTACSGSSSSSTARRSSTSTRSWATSTAASRSCARTPTTTRRSPTSTRSSTSARCSASGRGVMAFEKLLDVEVPRRAEYIRVLSAELNRIASHAPVHGLDGARPGRADADPVDASSSATRSSTCSPSLTGQRMLFNYFRIGGVNGDLNHEFLSRLGDWMSRATTQIEAEPRAAQRERDLRPADARPRRRSTRATALRMCMTGPEPAGDRRPVRRPARTPVQRLPGARLRHPDARRGRLPRPLPAPDRRDQAEPPDHRPVPRTRCPTGRSWRSCRGCCGRGRAGRTPAIEGPRGQYAAYVISDGTDQPFRMRIHDPSFIHLQSVGVMMPGNLIADTMAVMASLDPIMGGVDK